MSEPSVNNGIHGPLNYKPETVKEIEEDLQILKTKHPIVKIDVYLAGITDKRWNNYVQKSKIF